MPVESRATSPEDSLVAEASAALTGGRPWRASRLLAVVLADSAGRTPSALLLAAVAASRWGGWPQVTRLLDHQPWLDTLDGGRGRLLLARAALEQSADSMALRHALAVPTAAADSVEGERLVLLGRALDRVDARDSAASTYVRAAERLPQLADWLLLRAAAVTDDSLERDRLYRRLTDSLARSRIPWTEAASHRRIGDVAGAATRYLALGAGAEALRLRLHLSAESAQRAAVRRDLRALISSQRGGPEAREAVALLDSAFAPLTPAEELDIGRTAGDLGLAARAVSAYQRAFAGGLGTVKDRYAYATALSRLGRHADAARQFNRVRGSPELAASAAYLRARSLVRDGQVSGGRAALVEIGRRYPGDTSSASSALFLLGDLASDNRHDASARTYYRRLTLSYPGSRFAPTARFRAALIRLLAGDAVGAAGEFDELSRLYPRSDEAGAATYWAGRAWAAAGASGLARTRWERVLAAEPGSYYAGLAAGRLGRAPWRPASVSDFFVAAPDADSIVRRAAHLARLGLAAESRWEYGRLTRTSDSSAERLLAVANSARTGGMASQSIQLARRALARGAPADARTYRLLYPIVLEDALRAEASEHHLDPSFLAALIRQESLFDPAATSAAGARGLTQVMPDLGGRLARALEYPVWDPVLLYQPDVSLQLGALHLQELAERYTHPVHLLAAYNAGVSRVDRWSDRVGVDDPEVFTERIPFVETRGYVRAILRNQDMYRTLYQWAGRPSTSGHLSEDSTGSPESRPTPP